MREIVKLRLENEALKAELNRIVALNQQGKLVKLVQLGKEEDAPTKPVAQR